MKIEITGKRALKMVETVISLRNRREAVNKTLLYYGKGLAEELEIEATAEEVLAGLDTAERTVTIEDKELKKTKEAKEQE